MPSHGDFDTVFGAAAALTAADKLSLYTEADIEIIQWGYIITVAGAWNGTPHLSTLEVEDAAGANPVVSGGRTMSYNGASVPLGSRVYVNTTAPLKVVPGRRVTVAVTQAGAATAGSGVPFIVMRRQSFHPDRQTTDINAGTPA